MYLQSCDEIEMKTKKNIPVEKSFYQRTSTPVEPLVIPNILEKPYDGWVKCLYETPTEVKVRGTNKILVGVTAGMIAMEKHSYQRTSTPIGPSAIPNIFDTTYGAWVKFLCQTPTEVKVRGTNKILVGIIAGMVCISSQRPTYAVQQCCGGQQEQDVFDGHFVRFADGSFYPWYGNQQFFMQQQEEPRMEGFGGCNCESCQ